MRAATFVDAGYLYGGGFTVLAGSNQPREYGELDLDRAIAKLRKTTAERTGNATLLRIYWYDGMRRGQPSAEQEQLAYKEDVKLRLGVVREGRQKGVDSLIVTDLIELARNHTITDAVVLAGDEDLRIGVQIAQSFGVRVHLIGITPSRANQSLLLLQEADTTTEWSKEDIEEILEFKPSNVQWSDGGTALAITAGEEKVLLDESVSEFLASLPKGELSDIAVLQPNEGVPRQYDSRLLGTAEGKLTRDLTEPEKRYIRSTLKDQAKTAVAASQTDS